MRIEVGAARGRAHDPSPRPGGRAQQEPFARRSREQESGRLRRVAVVHGGVRCYSRDTAFCFSSLSPSCFFSGFCLFLWLAVPWTSEQHRPPCTTATPLSRPLSSTFCQVCRPPAAADVLAVLGGCVCLCSRPELSLTFPPSSCFDWA